MEFRATKHPRGPGLSPEKHDCLNAVSPFDQVPRSDCASIAALFQDPQLRYLASQGHGAFFQAVPSENRSPCNASARTRTNVSFGYYFGSIYKAEFPAAFFRA